ncbi:MAG TPA: MoaF N-terminal domain-containing protein [Rhizomicrobium sp.]
MSGTPYPKAQMHRIAYTKLSAREIESRLSKAASGGPASDSPLSDVFAGKSIRIATDKGLGLSYGFRGKNRLTVSENGGAALEAGYGALALDHIVVFTHLVPGTQRGYAVVVDQNTNLATVFELWFSGYEDNREVQREIYYGYVEQPGRNPSEARHAATNRMEGHGYHWRQDSGIETLEFFPSAAYSHFVELTRLGGELGFCAPSDYIKIDNEYFIYTRTECEFSGIFTLYVIGLNLVEQVGLRLGFNAGDALEYYVFRGKGEWLGQLAHFEKFGDFKGDVVPVPVEDDKPPAKGARPVYRPMKTWTVMSKAEVDAVARKATVYDPESAMAGNADPPTDFLAGKKLTLRYDNAPAMEYRFDGPETLHWRKEGGRSWVKARYKAWESMPGVIVFGHLLEGEPDHDGHSIVADFHQGLVTCFNGYLNTPYFANEAGVKTLFGVIEMEGIIPPLYRRHSFSDEMAGRALTWEYSPGLTSMHFYSTPHTASWIIFTESGAGGMEWSGPASYVKIRDGLYFAYWLEEACNGTLGTILINLHTMHDAGVSYKCDKEGVHMHPVGALGRHAGKFDVARFYQVKSSGRTA